jgi:hypothetical protein
MIHVKVTNETTLTLPVSIVKIFKNREIPEELDIVIIEKKSEGCVDRVWDVSILMTIFSKEQVN